MGYIVMQQEYIGYGDFSEVQESGAYYIEAPVLGRSYSFMVGDDLYRDAFRESCRAYAQRGDVIGASGADTELVAGMARKIAVVLTAYELNMSVFTDDTGISESGNGIPDILDEIRYEAEWMLKNVESYGPEGEAAFAMALAKFSYLYQEYDTAFATECLKAADIAWKHADLSEEGNSDIGTSEVEKDQWKFSAAAELYRASGKQSYHTYVEKYLAEENYDDQMELPVLCGCVTYISTRQTVDLALCEDITKILTVRAEEAAKKVDEILFGEQQGIVDGDCQKMLDESMYLILINHMISSKEYALLIENCLHYLMGRNPQSVSYIEYIGGNNDPQEDENLGVVSWPEGNSRLILLLSDILNWQAEHSVGTE